MNVEIFWTIVFAYTKVHYAAENLFHHLSDTRQKLLYQLISPVFGFTICDYYLGSEALEPEHNRVMPNQPRFQNLSCRALDTNNVKKIPRGTLLYVQVNAFNDFVNVYLPLLQTQILLMSGQIMLPAIQYLENGKSHYNTIISHPKIYHWFPQNPFIEHTKITPIPYGIWTNQLEAYARALKRYDEILFNSTFSNTTATNNSVVSHKKIVLLKPYIFPTHQTRDALLPYVSKKVPLQQYYDDITASYFVLSPVGDRNDCFRHWESIGLEAMPICNCPAKYRPLFGENAILVGRNDLPSIIQKSDKYFMSKYRKPNRQLVLISYWKKIINDVRERLLNDTVFTLSNQYGGTIVKSKTKLFHHKKIHSI